MKRILDRLFLKGTKAVLFQKEEGTDTKTYRIFL